MQDPTLLELAWAELLENNKSATVEEFAEVFSFSVHDSVCGLSN